MTDEKYTFIEDIRQKSSTAKSSHYKKTSGGKHVKFPSDYLSKKEKNKMNGEIKGYDLNKPMDWTEFKAMPDDLKKEYIEKIQKRFNVYRKTISKELFHINARYFDNYSKSHGFASGRGGDQRKKEDLPGFKDWIFSKGQMPNGNMKEKVHKTCDRIYPNRGNLTFNNTNIDQVRELLSNIMDANKEYSITVSFSKNIQGENNNED